jgi:hypothetical protein
MRQLALLAAVVLAVGLSACSSSSGGGTQQMAACCKTTADLKAQIPKCCADESSQCCKDAKMGKVSDCCKKAGEIKAKLPECCAKNAAGTPQACCTKK